MYRIIGSYSRSWSQVNHRVAAHRHHIRHGLDDGIQFAHAAAFVSASKQSSSSFHIVRINENIVSFRLPFVKAALTRHTAVRYTWEIFSGGNHAITNKAYGTDHRGSPCNGIYDDQRVRRVRIRAGFTAARSPASLMPDRNGKSRRRRAWIRRRPGLHETNRRMPWRADRPVGNRIGGAAFVLDGKTYTLQANNGANNLHGGPDGFDKRVFERRSDRTAGWCFRL